MYVIGDLCGSNIELTRKFRIGATVVQGQVVVADSTNNYATITDPPDVNTYQSAVGITYEAGTYAVASPGVLVKCSYSPFQVFRGKVSGGTAADTAFTDAQIVTQDSASTTVLTDTGVATSDYTGGLLIGLTGSAAGDIRQLTSQSDNTSCTVTVPFSASVAVGDTALRTYAPLVRGIELTTDFCQFNNLIAAGEAFGSANADGEAVVIDIIIDDQPTTSATKINIHNPSAPQVYFDAAFTYHFLNSLA